VLDRHRGGYCSGRPTVPYRATRSYLPDTAVLSTEFRTADGVARLTDLMPVSENGRFPLRQLIRHIEVVEGRMEMELIVKPRPDDGRTIPCFKRRHRRGADDVPARTGRRDLNWDYRYCWLRDVSFTAHAFMRLGFEQEAVAFTQWITHATALTFPAIAVRRDHRAQEQDRIHPGEVKGLAGSQQRRQEPGGQ